MLKTLRSTGSEKAPGASTQVNAKGRVHVDSPSYKGTLKKVNWPENGLEFLFIYPVEDGHEAHELYKRMKRDVKTGIVVMIFKQDGSAIAIDLATEKWKSYPGRPSEREMTRLQKGALRSCHPRHDPEGYFKAMQEHGAGLCSLPRKELR
jgi:hypothetical protein